MRRAQKGRWPLESSAFTSRGGALFDAFLPALENWSTRAEYNYEGGDWDEYVEEDEDNWDEYEEDEERIAAINGERGVAAQRAALGWDEYEED